MDIVKNNLLSIICGVVVLVALVVPFWPMGGYKKTLEQTLTDRVGVYNSLNSIRTKSRNLPVVDPDNTAAQPLDTFPTEQIIAKGNEVKAAFETQSKALLETAYKLNAHTLLVPHSLPTPGNSAIAFDFRDKYRDMIVNGFPKALKVGTPPTPDQIQVAMQKLWDSKYKPSLGGDANMMGSAPGGASGAMANARQALMNEWNTEKTKIPDIERNKVALSSLLYMNPDALPFNAAFNATSVPQPTDIWYAQLDLWIIQDVARAILDANSPFKNVTEAPVKHLVKINIPKQPSPYIVAPNQTLDGDLTGPAPKVTDLGTTPMTTGRVSNPLYDVVQFDLVVNVDAAHLASFLETLSHNRFLTVVQASVSAVDSGALQQQGYMYGPNPVVQLTLKCEDVFFHKWERPLMPDIVAKSMTGQPGQPGMGPGDMPPMY